MEMNSRNYPLLCVSWGTVCPQLVIWSWLNQLNRKRFPIPTTRQELGPPIILHHQVHWRLVDLLTYRALAPWACGLSAVFVPKYQTMYVVLALIGHNLNDMSDLYILIARNSNFPHWWYFSDTFEIWKKTTTLWRVFLFFCFIFYCYKLNGLWLIVR